MPDLLPHTGLILVGLSLLAFIAAALWEARRPLVLATPQVGPRWAANFGLFVAGHLAGYGLVPVAVVMAAWQAQWWGGMGLDAAGAALGWQVLATLLVLDAVRWATHWALHHLPWLWRLHQVHHCDTEFDCTVGVRFHPLEALLMAVVSSAAVLLLGVAPLAVVLAETVFIAHNFFCHANAALPPRVERVLRRYIVTPDLHRVHHAADPALADLNFGAVFTLWDRLAGCWHAVPREAQAGLRFGMAGIDGECTRSLWRLLALPLARHRRPVKAAVRR